MSLVLMLIPRSELRREERERERRQEKRQIIASQTVPVHSLDPNYDCASAITSEEEINIRHFSATFFPNNRAPDFWSERVRNALSSVFVVVFQQTFMVQLVKSRISSCKTTCSWRSSRAKHGHRSLLGEGGARSSVPDQVCTYSTMATS